MIKDKTSVKSVFAVTLALLQLLFLFLPTVSLDRIEEDSDYDTLDIDASATGPLTAVTLFYSYAVTQSANERELEYAFENSNYLQDEYDNFDEYLEEYYDDQYDSEDDEPETTSSLMLKVFLILIPLAAAFFFLAYGIKSKEDSGKSYLLFAISASIFVLASLISLSLSAEYNEKWLSDDAYIDKGITVFGWISIVAAAMQWFLFFTHSSKPKAVVPADYAYSSYTGYDAHIEAEKVSAPTFVPSHSTPTESAPASRVGPRYIPDEPVAPAASEAPTTGNVNQANRPICLSCGAALTPGTRFCYRCGREIK